MNELDSDGHATNARDIVRFGATGITPKETPHFSFDDVAAALRTCFATHGAFVDMEVVAGPNRRDHLVAESVNGNVHIMANLGGEAYSLHNWSWAAENMPGIVFNYSGTLDEMHPYIWMGGYQWSATMFTRDLTLAETIFREFHETGKITHPWWD